MRANNLARAILLALGSLHAARAARDLDDSETSLYLSSSICEQTGVCHDDEWARKMICRKEGPYAEPKRGGGQDVLEICDQLWQTEDQLIDLVDMGNPIRVVANILDLTTQEALVKLAHLYEEDAKQELWANHFTQMRALIEKEKQGFGKFLYEKLFKDAQNRAYRSGWIRYWHNTEL